MHNTLRRLHSEDAISVHFMELVRAHLSNNNVQPGLITPEIELIITLCTHHGRALHKMARDSNDDETSQRKIWIMDFASIPAGDWLPLRARLSSFIRLFSLPPRARNSHLFSPETHKPGGQKRPEIPNHSTTFAR